MALTIFKMTYDFILAGHHVMYKQDVHIIMHLCYVLTCIGHNILIPSQQGTAITI